MDDIPMIYDANPLSFKPRAGYGIIYRYILPNYEYIGQTKVPLSYRHRGHLRKSSKDCPVDEELRKNSFVLVVV